MDMEEKTSIFENLLDRATDYGLTSYELAKLKIIDKVSDSVSVLIPNCIAFLFLISFLLFFNIGLAFWLGEIFGKVYLGFAIVAAFYGLLGIIFHFLLRRWIKGLISNFIIKHLLK